MNIILVTLLQVFLQVDQEANEIGKKIVASRRNITSGHIQVTGSSNKDGKGHTKSFYWEFWFSGDKLRQDSTQYDLGPMFEGKYVPSRNVKCLNCPNSGFAIYGVDAKQVSFNVVKIEDWPKSKGKNNTIILDPRKIGFVSTGVYFLDEFDFDIFTNLNKLKNFSMSSTVYQGFNCTKFEWDEQSGAHVTYIISPRHSYNPLLISYLIKEKDKIAGTTLEVEFPEKISGSAWFPTKLRTITKNNNEVLRDEIFEIISDNLNQKIDPTIFTVNGLNLKYSHVIIDKSKENGKEIFLSVSDDGIREFTPSSETSKTAINDSGPALGGRKLWLVIMVSSIGLVFFGICLLIKKMIKNKT